MGGKEIIEVIDTYTNSEKECPENYESDQPRAFIPTVDIVVTRKPYPSTRNKAMPSYFCSEETLFSAAKYETDRLPAITPKQIGKNNQYYNYRISEI
jgi:hypothetical protein